jgi:hypothetical protein
MMICDVCNAHEAIAVASSGLGPMSNAYCVWCAHKMAEPYWMFEFTYEQCGDQVAEHVKILYTYKDFKYISWDDFVKSKGVNNA